MTVSRHRYGEYDTSYLAAGGMDGLRHLTEQFYQFLGPVSQCGPSAEASGGTQNSNSKLKQNSNSH